MGRRKEPAPGRPSDAIQREAAQLAKQAHTRLRVSGASGASLAAVVALDSPVERLRGLIDLAGELAPTMPASVAEHALPCGSWWRKRLADLDCGRTFEVRKTVTREDGAVVNLPMYPEGDPK